MVTVQEKNQHIFELINGTLSSVKNVIPVAHEVSKPFNTNQPIAIEFGVLIGFIGDLCGKLVIKGDAGVFRSLGEVIFGMAVDGDMLTSLTGELGNMIAGGMSTHIAEKGMKTDITSPTIMQGDARLSGYKKVIALKVDYTNIGTMDIQFLLD